MQRHEEVVVARQVGAHVGLGVDQRLQAPRDAQHHVLCAQAAAADGARVASPPWPGSSAMVSMRCLRPAVAGGDEGTGSGAGRLLAHPRLRRIGARGGIALDVFEDAREGRRRRGQSC